MAEPRSGEPTGPRSLGPPGPRAASRSRAYTRLTQIKAFSRTPYRPALGDGGRHGDGHDQVSRDISRRADGNRGGWRVGEPSRRRIRNRLPALWGQARVVEKSGPAGGTAPPKAGYGRGIPDVLNGCCPRRYCAGDG